MPELHRIKDPVSGAEYTYDDAKVVALGLQDEVVDKPTRERNGKPAAAKPRMPLGTPRPGSAQDRRRTQTSGDDTPGKDAGQSSADTEEEK